MKRYRRGLELYISLSIYSVQTGPRMARPGISLQDLIDRFQLLPALLDKKVSEEDLRKISRIIDDHEIIGPELGLTKQEMTAISPSKTHKLQRLETLRKWKQKYAFKATYRELIEALLECGRGEQAEYVCELLAQSEC